MTCLVLVALGFMMIGGSFTGMYSWDRYSDVCRSEADCLSGKSCCVFFEESYGICAAQDSCEGIAAVSREEKAQVSSADVPKPDVTEESLVDAVGKHIESPGKVFDWSSLYAGLILLALAIVTYFWGDEPASKRKK